MKAECSSSRRRPGLAHKLTIVMLAIAATVLGLFVAVLAGGPIIRELLGPPPGFHEDFVSREANNQALLVQALAIGFGFLFLGTIFGHVIRPSWKLALLAANPLTVGLGFVVFRVWYQSLRPEWQYEYYGLRNGALLAIAAPVVFGIFFHAGATISQIATRKHRTT